MGFEQVQANWKKPANFLTFFPCIEITYKIKLDFCTDLQFDSFKAAPKVGVHMATSFPYLKD